MKAHIIDQDALLALSPQVLSAYARAEGWVRTQSYGSHSDIYEKIGGPELIIPGTSKLGDYASAVSDLIYLISNAEERSELQVYRDLIGADRDVIRIRAPDASDDGSIKIDDGVDIFARGRDMLLSAACSAREKRASYRAGSNKEASSYMEKVRLGQTERGSFVVTLLAPVPPTLMPHAQEEFWPRPDSEPYERLVTRSLADGLEASLVAAEEAVRGKGYESFQLAIRQGVSANLCEAVASLVEIGAGLDVSVTWARTRPAPESRRVIKFSRNDGEVLQEAARMLRAQEPRPEELLEGYVTGLDRKLTSEDGRVTLKTFVDGKPVSVKTTLLPEIYTKAVEAHDTKQAISIVGDLTRDGQRWKLLNPRNMNLLVEDDPDDNNIYQRI